jgi:PAS domain S-box-containing protein
MPNDPRDLRAATALDTEDEGAALRAYHRLALDVLEHGDALYVLDSEFRFVVVNEAQERISRKPRSQTLGRVLWNVFPEAASPDRRYWHEYHRCMNERVPVAFEEHYAPLGIWAAVSAFPVKAGGIAVFFRDITEQKQAERGLRESEARYRMLFQNMLDGFAYCRMLFDERGRPDDFVYLDVNGAFSRLTGCTMSSGRRSPRCSPGSGSPSQTLLETYGRVARSGESERFEIHFRPLGIWLSISVYSPQADHFVAVFDNITERKLAEQTLRESDRRKSDFLAMLSHELRNPLAPVHNALWILENADRADQAAAARATLNRQVMHLTRIVDDLLDVTRVARGKTSCRRRESSSATWSGGPWTTTARCSPGGRSRSTFAWKAAPSRSMPIRCV